MNPKVSLDQWRAFIAVVEQGGYAQAAAALHLSQSSVSYAVAKLQELLGVTVLALEGRRARLTPVGEALLPRARQLVGDAGGLEQMALDLAQGWEAELRLVVDALCPTPLLLEALRRFRQTAPETRLQVREEVLTGTDEAILDGRTHLGVSGRVPEGCQGEILIEVDFIPVAHPDHALFRLGRPLQGRDLARHIQVFLRDTGATKLDDSIVYSGLRWTVSRRETALELLRQGFGFSWAPRPAVAADLAAGYLKPLPMELADVRRVPLYLVSPPKMYQGPASQLLAECILAASRISPSG